MRWKVRIGIVILSFLCCGVANAQNDIEFTVQAPYQTVSPAADGSIGAGEYSYSLFLSFVDRENPGYPWPSLDHMCPTVCDLDDGSPEAMGDDDLSATMYLAHTDEYLFLGFDVTDGFLDYDGIGAANAFKNDAVELYIDADADGLDAHGSTTGVFENMQIVADASDGAGGPALTVDDMEFNNRFVDHAEPVAVPTANPAAGEWYSAGLVHSETNYVVEFQIPLASLDVEDGDGFTAASTGNTLRFTAVIDDNDYEGSAGQDTYGELWYIEGDTRSNWGGAEDNWVVGLELSPAVVTNPGDFDNSGSLDAADINDLTTQSASNTNPPTYDLNADTLVNDGDVNVWVKDLFGSWIGDANLDKEFNSTDLVDVLAAGTYEVDVQAVWTTGDFNGDGRANSTDLVAALADGGYELGPPPAANAVPEPSGVLLLVLGVTSLAWRRRE
jgi:hypothetical protein